jgi:hypothetical protein
VHYSSAAVALVAALTFPLTALGETRSAIAVVPGADEIAPADGAPKCNATWCQSIKRYKNTGLVGVTEYDPTPPANT